MSDKACQCPHCPSGYTRANDLARHMKDKHGIPIVLRRKEPDVLRKIKPR